jgi:mRNA interferase RelE/StbE
LLIMSKNAKQEFEVRLRSKRVQRELDNLPPSDYNRVIVAVKSLATQPRPKGCEKLHDSIYRIRVGDIRVIYLIDDPRKRVDLDAVRRRSESTYKEIKELFR